MIYSNWFTGNPKNRNKRCIIKSGENTYQWLDEQCTEKKRFYCQFGKLPFLLLILLLIFPFISYQDFVTTTIPETTTTVEQSSTLYTTASTEITSTEETTSVAIETSVSTKANKKTTIPSKSTSKPSTTSKQTKILTTKIERQITSDSIETTVGAGESTKEESELTTFHYSIFLLKKTSSLIT